MTKGEKIATGAGWSCRSYMAKVIIKNQKKLKNQKLKNQNLKNLVLKKKKQKHTRTLNLISLMHRCQTLLLKK
jgi:hypothetical protein